jgi:hypothetical protein
MDGWMDGWIGGLEFGVAALLCFVALWDGRVYLFVLMGFLDGISTGGSGIGELGDWGFGNWVWYWWGLVLMGYIFLLWFLLMGWTLSG